MLCICEDKDCGVPIRETTVENLSGQSTSQEDDGYDRSRSSGSSPSHFNDASVVPKQQAFWEGDLFHRIPSGSQNLSRKIFVGNLPRNTHEDELFSAFASFKIEKVLWFRSRNESGIQSSIITNNFAHIVLETENDARKLYKRCKYSSDNLWIFQIATSNGLRTVKLGFQEKVDTSLWKWNEPLDNAIYLNHLHMLMGYKALCSLMEGLFGEVKYCQLFADRYGYPAGTAVVVFKRCSSFEKALNVQCIIVKTPSYKRMIELKRYEVKSKFRTQNAIISQESHN